MTQKSDRPEQPSPTETAAVGPWGGPVYSYRNAEIRCNRRGQVCALLMPGHPLHGSFFGAVGTITPLIDLWVEERRLPGYMRAVPKAGE
jgi:hypothetical protein